jgi:hypothetical protein
MDRTDFQVIFQNPGRQHTISHLEQLKKYDIEKVRQAFPEGKISPASHRFRKTFACWHRERNQVSVNTLCEWLGHESLM